MSQKQKIFPLEIKDNTLSFKIDSGNPELTEVETVALYDKMGYANTTFADGSKGSLVRVVNLFENNKHYFRNIEIAGQTYIASNDYLAIANLSQASTKLSKIGIYPVNVDSISLVTKRMYTVARQVKEVAFFGLQFDYSFVDNFAAPSKYYLALAENQEIGVDNDKVGRNLEKIKILLDKAGANVSSFLEALFNFDPVAIEEQLRFVKEKLPITVNLKATMINNNFVTFLDFSNFKFSVDFEGGGVNQSNNHSQPVTTENIPADNIAGYREPQENRKVAMNDFFSDISSQDYSDSEEEDITEGADI